ncbi:conserved hypothetical protein [Candida dubliniensis CD36]|uniref:BOD1/SHG1 domain-containing protein n=1 Tax=Candida dubliniensis (strain CD36 / ATCC MYA-646 / CBS 7987 / NCPF 3949 / NRRL Y-17841) TaxID=573826 RepID=B9W813_CANDC|nr:conserved hypothetical protein [Candida dubliniensis CD36]CAX44828.1 conserved hypothetical protein [Candida dubliniensis CD36]
MSQPQQEKDITDPKQLITIYKKKGKFDNQRRLLLDNFKQSETYDNLLLKLKLLIENKVKQDPNILMKNKGKMAALIQGEMTTNDTNELLNIVDKDIQDKIIDSFEFHNLIKNDLIDIKQELLGISDEEIIKLKNQEKLKLERLRMEAKLKNLKRIQQQQQQNQEQQQVEKNYKNNFKIKNLAASSSSSSSSNHRVNKPPRFNLRDSSTNINGITTDTHDKQSSQPTKEKKKDKIPFMMY